MFKTVFWVSCVRSTSILCLARKTVHNVMRELLFDPRHLYNIFLSRNPPSTHRQQNVSILHNSPRPHPQATKSVNIAQLTTTLSIGNKMCQYYATYHDDQYYGTHKAPNKFLLQRQPAAEIFKYQYQLTKLGRLSLKKVEIARYQGMYGNVYRWP